MKKNLLNLVIGLFPLIMACDSSLQGDPVALPIPFSGTLTADSNILIAEGNPLGGQNTALNTFLKNQTSDSPVSWEVFDGNLLDSCGTVTISSMTDPIVTPLTGGGEQREYFIDATLNGSDVEFDIAAHLQCFENRTPATPTQETLDLAATIPGATADVRKLVCSGPIDCVCPGGIDCDKIGCVEHQDLNLNLVTDVIQSPDGKTTFNTQRESNLIFDGPSGGGASFCAGDGSEPAGNVIMTLILQGFVAYLSPDSVPDAPPVVELDTFSVYLPGSDTASGTFRHHVHGTTGIMDESGVFQQFDTTATSDIFLNDGSFLRLREVTYEHTRIPELEPIFDEVIQATDLFLDDPNFSDLVFSANGGAAYHQTAGGTDLGNINFDPAAGEVTGVFQDLFEQFGPYTVQSRCLVMSGSTTKPPPYVLVPLILTLTTP